MKKFIFILFFLPLISLKAQFIPKWEEVQVPIQFKKSFFLDVFFLNKQPQFGWICGQNGEVLRTIDGGISWEGIQIFGADLESVMFANPAVGYVSGSDGIFKSIDSGKTFVDITPFHDPNISFSLWGCYLTDENNLWVIGGGCPNNNELAKKKPSQHFYKSIDGGQNWSLSSYCVQGNGLCDLVMYSPDSLGYASASGGIWRTLDGGRNWDIFSETGTYDWAEEMCVLGNSFLVPVSYGCQGSFDPGAMRFSNDLGKTWKEGKTQGPMFGAFLLDSNKGWGIGQKTSCYYTCNSGQNWELVNCGITGDLDDIWFINDTTAFCVGNKVFKLTNSKSPNIFISIDTIKYCEGEIIDSITKVNYFPYNNTTSCFTGRTQQLISNNETITYHYKNDCDNIEIKQFVPKLIPPVFPKIIVDQVNCLNHSILLHSSEKYFNSKWVFNDSNNIVGNGNDYSATQNGNYFLVVENELGCKYFSQPVNIEFSDLLKKFDILGLINNELTFDSVYIGESKCKDLKIYNNFDFDVTLDRVSLFQNKSFSIPQSIFPILIKSKDTINLPICLNPTSTKFVNDTLQIYDTCSQHLIYLKSLPQAVRIDGFTNCELKYKIKINKYTTSSIIIKQLSLSTDKNYINILLDSKNQISNSNIKIVNILGQTVFEDELEALNSSESSKLYNISNISNGNYFLIISNNDFNINTTFIINR